MIEKHTRDWKIYTSEWNMHVSLINHIYNPYCVELHYRCNKVLTHSIMTPTGPPTDQFDSSSNILNILLLWSISYYSYLWKISTRSDKFQESYRNDGQTDRNIIWPTSPGWGLKLRETQFFECYFEDDKTRRNMCSFWKRQLLLKVLPSR